MSLAPATPLPTKSNSYSRTTQVIEQLQTVWDAVQNDLVSVKTQLEQAHETKRIHDQQSKMYIQSNQECRNDIQALMALLESKQLGLKETKQVSSTLESQAKQLKEAAVDARRQADMLKKQERQLGQEKETAVMAKARVVQQHKVLQQAVQDLDQRARYERFLLQKQLGQVQSQLAQVVARDQLILLLATANGMNKTQRETWLQHVRALQHRLIVQQDQLDGGMDKMRSDVDGLVSAVALSYGKTAIDQMVTQCQDEVHGLIQRIRSYSLMVPR